MDFKFKFVPVAACRTWIRVRVRVGVRVRVRVIICPDILFCTFLLTSVISVQLPNHHFLLSPQLLITTSPHHNTGPHGAAQFNKSLKNIADHLQFFQGNSIPEAVRNMAPIKIDIPPSPQGKSSGTYQTSSILCQVIVTDRKSFPTHLR